MKRILSGLFILGLTAAGLAPAAAAPNYLVKQKTLATYSGNTTALSAMQKAQVKATVEANPDAEKFICTGIRYYSQSMSVNIMGRKRAKAACEYAKQLNPSLSTWFQNKPTQARSYAGKVLLTVKSPAPVLQETASADISICKVPDGRGITGPRNGSVTLGSYGMSNVGFPQSPDLIPIQGEANLVVVPVAFSDLAPAPSDVSDYLTEQTAKMTEWSQFWSQGEFEYKFQVVEQWQVLDETEGRFATSDVSRGERTVETQVALANAIVAKVGNQVDWAKAHGILVLFPLGFTAYINDWGGRGDQISTPAGTKPLFFWGGGEYHLKQTGGISLEAKRELLWSFWIHELLHSQGNNLHAPANGWAVGLDRNQYPAFGKFSGALSSWEAFRMGWVSDSQVLCIDGREDFETSFSQLIPQEVLSGDRKLVIIRTADHEALIVESRRPIGYSKSWASTDSGIFVTKLNTSVMNDRTGEGGADCGNSTNWQKWAYILPPDGSKNLANACAFEPFLLSGSDRVTSDGITVSVVSSTKGYDYVKVEN